MRAAVKPSRRKHQLTYSRLEMRQLLVGDVSVFLEGSTLVVEGDQLAGIQPPSMNWKSSRSDNHSIVPGLH